MNKIEINKLDLASGKTLENVQIAYETYGKLNADKSNAILICHALTGDQFVASENPTTKKPGWWGNLVGNGKIIDTQKYFVICSNVLGGCMGSTGPRETDPKTKKPYALNFPVITISDIVLAQAELVKSLGIEKLYAVIGGSMGAMQALCWASEHSQKIAKCISIAGAAKHSAQNIAFHEIGRQAVMADTDWAGGDYLAQNKRPAKGLSVARMAAHVTYLSENAMTRKFARGLQEREDISHSFDADFAVESYLRYQGSAFVERFDANSYLYITRAMDYFDLAAAHDDSLPKAFKNAGENHVKFCIVSFSSDWLFPTSESKEIVRALNAAACDVSFAEIETDKGHDAFLLDEPEFHGIIKGFLGN